MRAEVSRSLQRESGEEQREESLQREIGSASRQDDVVRQQASEKGTDEDQAGFHLHKAQKLLHAAACNSEAGFHELAALNEARARKHLDTANDYTEREVELASRQDDVVRQQASDSPAFGDRWAHTPEQSQASQKSKGRWSAMTNCFFVRLKRA